MIRVDLLLLGVSVRKTLRKGQRESYHFNKRKTRKTKYASFLLNSKKAKEFMEWCGVRTVTSDFKEVPFSVLQSSKEIQASFLRGYFESDGSVPEGRKVVECCSASYRLIYEIQMMLLNFGIFCSVRPRYNLEFEKDYWYLTISSVNVDKFSEEIGFLSIRKQTALAKSVDRETDHVQTGQWFNYPNQKIRITKIKEDLKSITNLGDKWKNNFSRWISGKRPITPSVINKIEEEFNFSSPEMDWYKKLNYKVLFDEIVEINDVGIKEVADLYVPQTHSFNTGIMSHNTLTSEAYSESRTDLYIK